MPVDCHAQQRIEQESKKKQPFRRMVNGQNPISIWNDKFYCILQILDIPFKVDTFNENEWDASQLAWNELQAIPNLLELHAEWNELWVSPNLLG